MAMVAEFSMFPLGEGVSVSKYVARILDIVDRSGIAYQLHPMGTVVEGEWDEVMGVVRQCFEAMSADCERVEATVRLDWRRGATGRMAGKIASVEKQLGHGLKH